jgi:hypothetical protein
LLLSVCLVVEDFRCLNVEDFSFPQPRGLFRCIWPSIPRCFRPSVSSLYLIDSNTATCRTSGSPSGRAVLSTHFCLCAMQGYLRSVIVSPSSATLCLPIYRRRQCLLHSSLVVRWSALVCSELSSSQYLVYSNFDCLDDSNLEPELIPRVKHKATGRITCRQ